MWTTQIGVQIEAMAWTRAWTKHKHEQNHKQECGYGQKRKWEQYHK